MAIATTFSSDFDVYKTSTDAVIKEFKSGKLYAENPKQYFALVMSICNHFKRGLNNIQTALNSIITATYEFEDNHNYNDGVDFIYKNFDILDDYVNYICTDFEDFKKTITDIVPKEKLEYRCNIDFNLVDQLVMDLEKNLERIRSQLLSHFMLKLSDKELAKRAV